MKKRLLNLFGLILGLALFVFLMASRRVFFRLDMTADKRYSLSEATKATLKDMESPVTIKVYLGGKQDANFVHLRRAFQDMVDSYRRLSHVDMTYTLINPAQEDLTEKERYQAYAKLEQKGLRGLSVAAYDKNGDLTQRIVFPWAEVISHGDTMKIQLMNPTTNAEGSEAVNLSIAEQEYKLTDALRVLSRKKIQKIAILEGHGEPSEAYTYSFSLDASKYFQVDRGQISATAGVLDGYDAVVVAGPKTAYSESEKFVLDQYIMHGGAVLFLVDGVKLSETALQTSGMSPLLALEVNLQDMLFKYGVRIDPTLVADMQCIKMPVNTARVGQVASFQNMSWYYAPLLNGSPKSVITKNGLPVLGRYISTLSFTSENPAIHKEILLLTSNATHLFTAPNELNLKTMLKTPSPEFFNSGYRPVAAVMEGHFPSIYAHRMPPPSVDYTDKRDTSVLTRMAVVGCSRMILNEMDSSSRGYMVLPMGYDRVGKTQYGNSQFLINTLLYLTDHTGVMALRNRTIALRLLNNSAVKSSRKAWMWINLLGPLSLLGLLALGFWIRRRQKLRR